MSAPIKTYRKMPIERRRLYLDYSCWLETSEVLSNFQATVVPFTSDGPLTVASSYPDAEHKRLMLFVSGGKPNQNYTLQMVITTDQGQIKQDNIGIMVVSS
jgi:hypothetical protein